MLRYSWPGAIVNAVAKAGYPMPNGKLESMLVGVAIRAISGKSHKLLFNRPTAARPNEDLDAVWKADDTEHYPKILQTGDPISTQKGLKSNYAYTLLGLIPSSSMPQSPDSAV